VDRRRRLMLVTLAADVAVVVAAYVVAFVARFDGVWGEAAPVRPDWSLVVVLAATLLSFYGFGLYKREAYVSRPLHVFALAEGTFAAFVVAAVIVYLLKSPAVQQSRFIVVMTFVLIFLLCFVARITALDHLFRHDVARHRARTLVIGRSPEVELLNGRLAELRGYAGLSVCEPGSEDDDFSLARRALEKAVERDAGRVDNVFIDTASVPPRVTLDLVHLAKRHDVEVYVLSHLLSPLDSTRLLLELFDMPVMRVHLHPHERRMRVSKRGFDIVGSLLALIFLAPVLLAITLAVKLTSRGPVFYSDERVGLRGRLFRFHKFRSMEQGSDHGLHKEYVCRFINGELVCTDDADLEPDPELAYKIVDDPRITRVGAFLRRYSLDELPQFWNVLMGDMSLVGPRPALPYEVEHYKEWHRERLAAMPGVSGVWQISGRSRVGFDEMVFEDVMYTYNQSILTDLVICLRTIPVVLLGRGAA